MASIYQDYSATLQDYLRAGIPLEDAKVYYLAGLAVNNGAIQGYQAGSVAAQAVNYYIINTGLVPRSARPYTLQDYLGLGMPRTEAVIYYTAGLPLYDAMVGFFNGSQAGGVVAFYKANAPAVLKPRAAVDQLDLSAAYAVSGVAALVPKGSKAWWVIHRRSGTAPVWLDCFNEWAKAERARLATLGWGLSAAVPIDRAWASDVDSQRVKHEIDTSYLLSLDEFNDATGANIPPYLPVLGINAQTTTFAANGSLDPRPKGGWIEQNSGTLLALAAIAAAVYTGGASMGMFGTTAASGTAAATATAADIAASQGVIATMAGSGISDAVIAQSIAGAAASVSTTTAAAAMAEMTAASWGTLATGAVGNVASGIATLAQNMPTNLPSAPSASSVPSVPSAPSVPSIQNLPTIQQGAKVGTIFDTITGTIQQTVGAAGSVYSSVQGMQLQKAQIDLANRQAQAALQPAPQPFYQSAAGGTNWTVIGLIGAALVGVVLMVRR